MPYRGFAMYLRKRLNLGGGYRSWPPQAFRPEGRLSQAVCFQVKTDGGRQRLAHFESSGPIQVRAVASDSFRNLDFNHRREGKMRYLFVGVCFFVWLGFSATTVWGQQMVGDLFVYAAEGQSQDQQSRDMWECQDWARQTTGFDPMATPQASTPPPPSEAPRGGGPARRCHRCCGRVGRRGAYRQCPPRGPDRRRRRGPDGRFAAGGPEPAAGPCRGAVGPAGSGPVGAESGFLQSGPDRLSGGTRLLGPLMDSPRQRVAGHGMKAMMLSGSLDCCSFRPQATRLGRQPETP